MNQLLEKTIRDLPFLRCCILSSTDPSVRFEGSSGGVVTELVRSLFREDRIRSAVCFEFSGKELFIPRIVYSGPHYLQNGSIYHEVHLIRFLRENQDRLRSPILITCLPCQILAIRRLMKTIGIESVIISLMCSGQLTRQATYDFLQTHRIPVDRIRSFRYRGRGWPSGIHVELDDGKAYFYPNTESDWICFFHASIYNLERCFHCQDTLGIHADLTVADPWLRRYIDTEKIGCTAVCLQNNALADFIRQMIAKKQLQLHETLDLSDFIAPQLWTIAKKQSFRKFPSLRLCIRLFRTRWYRRLFLTGRYRHFHYKLYMKLLNRYRKKLHA